MTHNPLSPARDEENRRLAEWITPSAEMHEYNTAGWRFDKVRGWQPAEFYTDEAANALLLEKMPLPTLSRHRIDRYNQPVAEYWQCHLVDGREASDPDRKTAIVKCALAYLEAQK